MKVILKNVRIAYCKTLFKAEQYQGAGNFRHSATFVVPKGSDSDGLVLEAINTVAEERFGKKKSETLTRLKAAETNYCYKDGDDSDQDAFAGCNALTSNRNATDGAPMVVHKDKTPIRDDEGTIYGGCTVNAIVDIWAQVNTYVGIRCTLVAVQFVKDSPSFGGATRAREDDFEILPDTDFSDLM